VQFGDGREPHLLQAREHEGHVDISLCNSGEPLSANEYQGWFEPFFRASSTSVTVSGAGLGLTVASRLAEAQRGKLEARPWDSGQGTMVSLTLPAVDIAD
jgi:K+-sensing histidine kinase KdpD